MPREGCAGAKRFYSCTAGEWADLYATGSDMHVCDEVILAGAPARLFLDLECKWSDMAADEFAFLVRSARRVLGKMLRAYFGLSDAGWTELGASRPDVKHSAHVIASACVFATVRDVREFVSLVALTTFARAAKGGDLVSDEERRVVSVLTDAFVAGRVDAGVYRDGGNFRMYYSTKRDDRGNELRRLNTAPGAPFSADTYDRCLIHPRSVD